LSELKPSLLNSQSDNDVDTNLNLYKANNLIKEYERSHKVLLNLTHELLNLLITRDGKLDEFENIEFDAYKKILDRESGIR